MRTNVLLNWKSFFLLSKFFSHHKYKLYDNWPMWLLYTIFPAYIMQIIFTVKSCTVFRAIIRQLSLINNSTFYVVGCKVIAEFFLLVWPNLHVHESSICYHQTYYVCLHFHAKNKNICVFLISSNFL